MKKLKIILMILILLFGFFIPNVYSTISGNFAVSMVDPVFPLKYYTMMGDTTNGLWVNVKSLPTLTITGSATLTDAFTNPTNAAVTGSFLMGWNGATWDKLRGDTTNGLWVNIKTGVITSITNTVNSFVTNTVSVKTTVSASFTYNQVAVASTATLIKSANVARNSLIIRNQGSVDEYVGDAAVTIGTGILLHVNDVFIDDRSTAAWYGITSSSTTTTAWVEE